MRIIENKIYEGKELFNVLNSEFHCKYINSIDVLEASRYNTVSFKFEFDGHIYFTYVMDNLYKHVNNLDDISGKDLELAELEVFIWSLRAKLIVEKYNDIFINDDCKLKMIYDHNKDINIFIVNFYIRS